jgi:hypothetical protein
VISARSNVAAEQSVTPLDSPVAAGGNRSSEISPGRAGGFHNLRPFEFDLYYNSHDEKLCFYAAIFDDQQRNQQFESQRSRAAILEGKSFYRDGMI